jgi:hypothetical protein
VRAATILNVLGFIEQKHFNATGTRDLDCARRFDRDGSFLWMMIAVNDDLKLIQFS